MKGEGQHSLQNTAHVKPSGLFSPHPSLLTKLVDKEL